MKILNVLAQLPMRTGSGVYFSNLVDELTQLGHDNLLVYGIQDPYHVELSGIHYPIQFNTSKLPFPIAGMSDVMPYENTIYSQMSPEMIDNVLATFKEKLLHIKEQEKIDLVITHHLFFLSSMVREIFDDVPVVAFCHGTDLRQLERFPHFLERCQSIHKMDRIFVVSPKEIPKIHELFSYDKKDICLVGGGFDHKLFNRHHTKPIDNILRVCYAGKLSHSKGVYELASTFPKVKEEFDAVEYHLIGSTSPKEKKKLEELAGNLEGFKVYDAKDQQTMAHHLKQCDVFVLPSYYEALGLIAIEAMATGLFAVTSEIEGLQAELGDVVNQSGAILYTALPTIYDLDKPVAAEIPAYVDRLATNIIHQLHKVQQGVPISEEVQSIINRKSWYHLAKRIETELNDVVDAFALIE